MENRCTQQRTFNFLSDLCTNRMLIESSNQLYPLKHYPCMCYNIHQFIQQSKVIQCHQSPPRMFSFCCSWYNLYQRILQCSPIVSVENLIIHVLLMQWIHWCWSKHPNRDISEKMLLWCLTNTKRPMTWKQYLISSTRIENISSDHRDGSSYFQVSIIHMRIFKPGFSVMFCLALL